MTSARDILASNRVLSVFLLKMAVVYAVWFVIYDLWLLPEGHLDEWLSQAVASMTGVVLGWFYDTASVSGRTAWISSDAGVIVEDGCNGLSALSLFVGFVLAYPGTWVRRALFIPLGLVAIVAVNVIRCASLVIVQEQWPQLFGEVHGLHALFVFYIAIFGLWMVWAHWGGSVRTMSSLQAV